MAYPVINYNETTGSDTNPSDALASSVTTSQTVSGTSGTTTVTFSANVNLTGAADDDSDWIWINTGASQKLFRITAFSGTISSCSGLTVEPALPGDLSAVAWHIGGTRADIDDNSNWGRGWTAVLEGSFTTSDNFHPGDLLSSSGNAANDPPITIKAKDGLSTKPSVTVPTWAKMLEVTSYLTIKCIGIHLSQPASNALSTCFVDVNQGGLTMIDCAIVNASTNISNLFESVSTNRALRLYNCYIKGGGTRTFRIAYNSHMVMDNCWVDCDDTFGSTTAILLEGEDNVITDSLITGAVGSGVQMDADSTTGQDGFWYLKNCTIEGCGGDGIELTGTPVVSSEYSHTIAIINCLIANNSGYGVDWGTEPISPLTGDIDFNCLFNNTLGGYNGGGGAGDNDVTITSDPFTNAATGDFSLNDVSTGGALLRDAARYTLPTAP